MKILMLSAQYMPEVYGGAEQQCQKLAKRLVKAGVNVVVLTSRQNNRIKKEEIIDGVKVVRLNAYGPPQLMNARYFYSTIAWILKAVYWGYKNRNSFDIVHIHQAKLQAFVGLVIARLTHKRSIVKTGNSGQGFDLLTLKRKALAGPVMYRYVVKHTDVAIAISTHIEKELLSAGIPADKIVFLPNGVEVNNAKALTVEDKIEARHKLGIDVDKKVFLFVGRLEKQKDVLLLVNSFIAAKANEKNWLLVLVGDGALKPGIEKIIDADSLQDEILLAGYQKDVYAYLFAADFFILSTKTEGLSNALLEAMSVGLIPISTAVSGSTDLVVPGVNGFLTEISSQKSLVQAFQQAGQLTGVDVQAYSKNAMQVINEKYEMNLITTQYISLYNKMLGASTAV